MAERPKIVLDDAAWRAFQIALKRPAREKPRLAKLLSEPSVLEKAAALPSRKGRVAAPKHIRRMTPKRLSDDSPDLIRKDRDRR